MKLKKIRHVLRYHVPNKHLKPENFAHYLLFLFYPFRKETDLLTNNSYCETLLQSGVMDIVSINRKVFEPYSDELDAALFQFSQIEELEVDNDSDQINDPNILLEESYQRPVMFEAQPEVSRVENLHFVSDAKLREMIRSLNSQQRHIFDYVNKWAKENIQSKNCNIPVEPVKPLTLFITGGAGVGKSYLIDTMYQNVSKLFNLYVGSPEKIKVLKLAPTGIASINISGTTINTGLGIPINCFHTLPGLSVNIKCSLRQKYSELRQKYSELKVVIIDEISMVSNYRLKHIHQRLCEVMNVSYDIPFAGLTVIVVGDLHQLPPIRAKPVFTLFENKDVCSNLCHHWNYFQFFELTQTMRQQGDENFIKLLNNVRVGEIRQDDIDLLKARQVFDNSNLPSDCIYLFAENKSKDEVNDQKLSELPFPEIVSYASDIVPKGITKQKLDQINERSQSQCAGLAKCLTVKENAKVMLTSNIDISDRLINGQIGIIHSFVYENMNLKVIYVRFNDNEAGLKKRQSDLFAISNNVVPITKVEASIPVTLHSSNCFITRTQFPLMLSWASTIHKVQGLTLSNALVLFKLDKQKKSIMVKSTLH